MGIVACGTNTSRFRRGTKVLVFGAAGVGKSALICQFTETPIPEKKESCTLYREYVPLNEDEEPDMLEILEMPGKKSVFPLSKKKKKRIKEFMDCASGYILVYSLDTPDHKVAKQLENYHALLNLPNNRFTVVVGTKSDLWHGDPDSTPGAKYAGTHGFEHIITSANANSNVKDPFMSIFFRSRNLWKPGMDKPWLLPKEKSKSAKCKTKSPPSSSSSDESANKTSYDSSDSSNHSDSTGDKSNSHSSKDF
jgi:small GTP-binding protein